MEKYICNLCNGQKQIPPCPKCKGKPELDWVEYVIGTGDIVDFDYGYGGCMELAGATVHVFENFGDYQGTWWAKVTYRQITGWVSGSFGSCSGCDSFHAEFDMSSHDHEDQQYISVSDLSKHYNKKCEKCVELRDRLIKFGEEYLSYIYTQEEAEKEAAKNIEWDSDAETVVKFIRENAN